MIDRDDTVLALRFVGYCVAVFAAFASSVSFIAILAGITNAIGWTYLPGLLAGLWLLVFAVNLAYRKMAGGEP